MRRCHGYILTVVSDVVWVDRAEILREMETKGVLEQGDMIFMDFFSAVSFKLLYTFFSVPMNSHINHQIM